MNDIEARYARLQALLLDLDRVLVAFSGGVDSTFLLKAAVDTLGPRATALIAVSASLPTWELAEARELAEKIGARLIEVATHELDRPAYRANVGDRCYHCKTELFEVAREAARGFELGHLVYGAIPDDLGDHRPGMRAAAERAVRAPLIEAGLSKADIRVLSAHLGLPTASKPAGACLSSRFPMGTEVTAGRLGQVAACEAALHALGFQQVRARFLGDRVRIELDPVDLDRVQSDAALYAAVLAAGAGAGFSETVVDPRGYRQGGADGLVVLG